VRRRFPSQRQVFHERCHWVAGDLFQETDANVATTANRAGVRDSDPAMILSSVVFPTRDADPPIRSPEEMVKERLSSSVRSEPFEGYLLEVDENSHGLPRLMTGHVTLSSEVGLLTQPLA